jgi:hypothetical protein
VAGVSKGSPEVMSNLGELTAIVRSNAPFDDIVSQPYCWQRHRRWIPALSVRHKLGFCAKEGRSTQSVRSLHRNNGLSPRVRAS